MMIRISPCEFLEQISKMTEKERYELCWEPGSGMAGKTFHCDIGNDCWHEQPAHIRAIQGHSRPNLNITTFSHQKLETVHAQVIFHPGNSTDEHPMMSGGIVSGGSVLVILQLRIQSGRSELFTTKKYVGMFLLTRLGIGKESRPGVQKVRSLKAL